MAENVTLNNLSNLQNETTAVALINANNAAITTAFTDCVSRAGTSPNTMTSNLDLNGNRVINLAAPVSANDAARLIDVQSGGGGGGGGSGTVSGGANHKVAIFSAANTVGSSVGPGTSAQLLMGQGASADPSFVSVTGDVTITNAGVTAIGSHKVVNSQLAQMNANTIKANTGSIAADAADASISAVLDTSSGSPIAQGDILYRDSANWSRLAVGTSGQFLKTQGAAANPIWATPPSASGFTIANIQAFTASGTYTPTASMKYCIIECVGGGGAGGGMSAPTNTIYSTGGGGGSGGYSRKFASAATIGASKTVTCGAGGIGGAADGGAGGDTSVGTICVAKGGSGGFGWIAGTPTYPGPGAGGVTAGATGDVVVAGMPGGCGSWGNTGLWTQGGFGGSGHFGGGAIDMGRVIASTGNGVAGTTGGGGSGARSYAATANQSGGTGGVGYVVITEYI